MGGGVRYISVVGGGRGREGRWLQGVSYVAPVQSLLLRELCSFALALELEDGTKFYQKLCTYGLMPAMEQLLVSH